MRAVERFPLSIARFLCLPVRYPLFTGLDFLFMKCLFLFVSVLLFICWEVPDKKKESWAEK
jgi:hypothetical protein